ncbi:unnamed protein product [Chrysoparadoxa australica]
MIVLCLIACLLFTHAGAFSLLPSRLLPKRVSRIAAHATGIAEADFECLVSSINSDSELKEGLLKQLVISQTELGEVMKGKNAMTAGSFVIEDAELSSLDTSGLDMRVTIRERSFWGKVKQYKQEVRVNYPVEGEVTFIDGVKRVLMEMARREGMAKSTANIFLIPVGTYSLLPPSLKLNNVPHSTLARSFCYRGASTAVSDAVADGATPSRLKITCTVPELNPEMDTYRVGTMLELVREVTLGLVDSGKKVKVCIQGSMGEGIFTGMPLSLSGMRVIMERMDWGTDLDPETKTVLEGRVAFGAVGEEEVTKDKGNYDVYIVIAPQNMTGASIYTILNPMTMAAEAAGKKIILVNPLLKDKPSSAGVMSVRGRGDRIEFEKSFFEVYRFTLLYPSSRIMFPIAGAVLKTSHRDPYIAMRRDDIDGGGEEYKCIGTFDAVPTAEDLDQVL